jgi:glycerophosphoryl diester phosphodiesterase
VLIWTHRGNPGPENTLEAFAQAWADGIRFFETDIHCTKDGVLVLAHDPDISRLTGQSQKICDLTYDELAKFKIEGRWSWATLDQLVDHYPDATISIDIKSDDALNPFIKWGKNRNLNNFVIGSFSSKRTKAFRKAHPSARTALTTLEILAINSGLAFMLKRIPSAAVAMVPVSFKGLPILTKRFIRFCAQRRIQINVWTINDPIEAKRLNDLKVQGVITDDYPLFSSNA